MLTNSLKYFSLIHFCLSNRFPDITVDILSWGRKRGIAAMHGWTGSILRLP